METLSLFNDMIIDAPETEGIKYAGSKQKLLPHILSLVKKVNPKTVLDGFAGTTRVSQALAQQGYSVIANDVSVWSEIFATCYLMNGYAASHYAPMLKHLNHLPPEDGWFTAHYGGDANEGNSAGHDGLKKPWQRHNTRRLDSIRNEIDRLGLTAAEKAVLLTSLVYALDEVDNTMGHYASYLNEWSPRSYKTMCLQMPLCPVKLPSLLVQQAAHQVYRKDIFELLPQVKVDLAYLDPPYGSNNEKMPPSRVRYAAYYHLWTTVILNDRPDVFGKAKRRSDTSDTLAASVFEDFRRDDRGRLIAVEAIRKVIKEVNARYVLLSYSSGGRATAEQLHQVIIENGRLIETVEVDYRKNVMAGMRWTNEWIRDAELPNREFLFLIEKT